MKSEPTWDIWSTEDFCAAFQHNGNILFWSCPRQSTHCAVHPGICWPLGRIHLLEASSLGGLLIIFSVLSERKRSRKREYLVLICCLCCECVQQILQPDVMVDIKLWWASEGEVLHCVMSVKCCTVKVYDGLMTLISCRHDVCVCVHTHTHTHTQSHFHAS